LDGNNCNKADDSQKSFLFILKNPHNIAAQKFALNPTKKFQAIRCHSGHGPDFSTIVISDDCNARAGNSAYLGETYINSTRLTNEKVLAGSMNFKVKEIEVFEIAD
jgi:hypothetical protein